MTLNKIDSAILSELKREGVKLEDITHIKIGMLYKGKEILVVIRRGEDEY